MKPIDEAVSDELAKSVALQVLFEGKHFLVGSATGKANPVVLLDDECCAELLRLWNNANAAIDEFSDVESTDSIRKLCLGVGKFIEQYKFVRNKFFSGLHPLNEREVIIRELEQLSKEFDSPSSRRTRAFVCSFCGRDKKEVDSMVAGGDALICNECVHMANDMLAESGRSS
jgi:ClpX C4-type zinc finger